jgi:hypothetical protein
MVLKGGGCGPTKLGVMPLSDGAGEVAAIGEGVTLAKVGDRVIGTFHPRWFGGPLSAHYLTDRLGANLDGMLAEYAVLSKEALVPVPSHLSFEEAATLPCAAVTAWAALAGHRRVTAGRQRPHAGFGRCLGFCATICPGLGCPSDRDDLDRRKGRAAQGAGCLRGGQLHRDAGLGREGARVDRWPRRRLRRRDRRAGNDREIAEGLGRGRTSQPDRPEPAPSGAMLDPLLLTGRGITVGAINVGSRADFRSNEPGHRAASLSPCDRPDIPVRRGQPASPFRRPRPFRQGVITHG